MVEKLPFWNDLSEKEKAEVSEHARTQHFAKGTVLHAGQQDCSGLFLVENGRARALYCDTGWQRSNVVPADRRKCLYLFSVLFVKKYHI